MGQRLIHSVGQGVIPVMQSCTACVLLAIFLVISVLNASEAKEPELGLSVESRFEGYEYPYGILRNPAMPPELRTMILKTLNILEYADYLSYEPLTAEVCCLPDREERALLHWAYLRIQELRSDNDDERVIIERIEHAVNVLVRKRNISLVNYEQASLEERPRIAAQGMEHAVQDLRKISTRPFWVRLGIRAFIEFDNFPKMHKVLSKPFQKTYGHCMLRVAVLVGNMEAFDYLAASQRKWKWKWKSDRLQKLVKYACHGGNVGVFEWILSNHLIIANQMIGRALSWAVEAGKVEFLEFLMEKDPKLSQARLVDLAFLAIEKGRLATLKVLANKLGGAGAIVNQEHFSDAFCKAAANGNAQMVQYVFELGEDVVLDHPVLEKALQIAVEFGHLEVLEYLFEDSDRVDGLHGEFPALFSKLYLWAAWKGHLHIVRFLLSENVDGTPRFPQFNLACRVSHPVILGSHFPQVVSEHPRFDALALAARAGHEKIVEYLLMLKGTGKERFRHTDPTAEGHLALSHAILCRHQRIIDRLFQFLDPNVCTSSVSVACGFSGNLKMIQALTDMNLLKKTSPVLTRIMTLACSYGHLEIVKHILNNQLKYTVQHIAGEMQGYLRGAVENGHSHIVNYLLQKNGDGDFLFGPIDMATYDLNLLKLAAMNYDVPIVKSLLSIAREANININVLRDIDPLHYLNHYPTTEVISNAIYGPCPFPVGSISEMAWIVCNLGRRREKLLSKFYAWPRSPRTTNGRFMLLKTLALLEALFIFNVVVPEIASAPYTVYVTYLRALMDPETAGVDVMMYIFNLCFFLLTWAWFASAYI